jgi:hypothetical protein
VPLRRSPDRAVEQSIRGDQALPGQPRHHVGEPEEDHVGAAGAQPPHHVVEAGDHGVRVEGAAQHVVAAGGETDQVGLHRQGGGHLLGHHPGEEPATDRQVGVREVRAGLGGQPGRHQVRPAAVGAVRVRVVHALGEAVPHRHETTPAHVCSSGLRVPIRVDRQVFHRFPAVPLRG